jgi:hypothetical protein
VRPQRVIHADWSTTPTKRWAAHAELQAHGQYRVEAPKVITPRELMTEARAGSAFIGFDFPIGLPAAYARRAAISSFSALLGQLGRGPWSSFFVPATTPEEISSYRPFYPARAGGAKQLHLVRGLGLESATDLYRQCDVAEGRRACSMFWTLGGNQVGKAALTGWHDFLQPAQTEKLIGIWPFDGALDELLATKRTVVAETYPGALYPRIGATLPSVNGARGKRSQGSRAASAPEILRRVRENRIELSPELERELRDGFGPTRTGEDRFDAVVGVLGMLAVVQGTLKDGAPGVDAVRRVEGWILGRAAS